VTAFLETGPEEAREHLVDVVFGVPSPERSWRLLAAVGLAIGIHGSLWLWATRSELSLESWSAEVGAKVHAEPLRDEPVELAKPPPPPPEKVHARVEPKTEGPPKAARPAQAGAIIAQKADPNAPVDLGGETFVTGTASAYAGGITTSQGTSAVPVQDLSSPVALEDQSWSCAWPREADAEQIDEQTVVIRVMVRADGSVASASVLADPGHGFGPAAAACAIQTQFEPAHDKQGKPIQSQSPPIRVRFTR